MMIASRMSSRFTESQFPAGQCAVRLLVLFAGTARDLFRKRRRRRLLIPRYGFQVVANVLLVVGRLRASRIVGSRGPEAGGVRSQDLVGQNNFAVDQTKFKLGIRDDDAACPGVVRGFLVNVQRQV